VGVGEQLLFRVIGVYSLLGGMIMFIIVMDSEDGRDYFTGTQWSSEKEDAVKFTTKEEARKFADLIDVAYGDYYLKVVEVKEI
jgi:hypothetical protein